MPKKSSETAASRKAAAASPEAIDALVNNLADRPYGVGAVAAKALERQRQTPVPVVKAKPLSISLPPSVIEQLEDTVRDNKRSGEGPRTISAIVREALEAAGYRG
ncbi:hypothetical protein KGZ13_31115 [Pseudomonas aeruginosa]|uniref:hypothetical protein n=1 Tax=Pseudomonadaceae TaxID=135621 RepID=UPI000BD2BC0C|nr:MULTISPECIES: hypothetical protein [Pseudomonas]MDC3951697.1 hypothetical protein [Pseudomonas aeruginosa]OZB32504.1 MAG: hypothetical protein B7X51_06730 [Pseudomonas sp. 34-62-33]